MNKKTAFLITLLVALIIGYSIFAFYKTHERKEVIEHTGLLSEARRNPLYASRLFLKRMGIPAVSKNSVQGMGGFPSTDTVLVIVTKRSTLSESRTDELLDWVKSGGHLIARSVHDWNYAGIDKDLDEIMDDSESRDPLQQYLGITTGKSVSFDYTPDTKNEKTEESDTTNEDEDEEEDSDDSGFDDESTIGKIVDFFQTTAKDRAEHTISLKGVEKSLKIQSGGFKPLLVDTKHAAKSEQIKVDGHNFMVRQKVGNGLVTLVSDFRFVKNYHLEKSDHAEIFWHLVHGKHPSISQPANIWLIHNDEMPSLWDLLIRHAWTFMLSLLILSIAWLMMSARRFGPVIPKQDVNRRSLKEHITSSGNFYWKNNKKQKLIDSSRDALKQRLSQVHPGWAQRGEEEQVNLLAEQVSMSPKVIHKLLYDPNIEHPDDFIQLIKRLEKIRQQI